MQKLIETENNLIEFYSSELKNMEFEELRIPFLDSDGRWIMGEFKKNVGRKDTTGIIYLDTILREGIISRGECMFIFHNHPNEDSRPSENDIELTAALELSGNLIGIPVSDSIIISETGNYSFKENNQLLNFE